MQEFMSFERLMALFRYRGLDSGALSPGQAKTMEALLEAGRRVARDLEDLAHRQAALIEVSTRELMGSAQALAQPENFKQASEANLDTLTKTTDTTLRHLAELSELLMRYNAEVLSMMHRSMLDSMSPPRAPASEPPDAGEQAGPAAPARPKPKRRAKTPKPAKAEEPVQA